MKMRIMRVVAMVILPLLAAGHDDDDTDTGGVATPGVCECPGGTPYEGPACRTGLEGCHDCDDGFHPVGKKCVRDCVCLDVEGNPLEEDACAGDTSCAVQGPACARGNEGCAKCPMNHHFVYATSGGKRCAEDCTCTHGQPKLGNSCPSGGEVCRGCDAHYHLDPETLLCVPDCECEHGWPFYSDKCPTAVSAEGGQHCRRCVSAYHIVPVPGSTQKKCVKDCECPFGYAYTESFCGTGEEGCKRCKSGYHIVNEKECAPDCDCPGGSPKVGQECLTGNEMCDVCKLGYHSIVVQVTPERKKCVRDCRCNGGTPYKLAACTDGYQGCETCDDGRDAVQGVCPGYEAADSHDAPSVNSQSGDEHHRRRRPQQESMPSHDKHSGNVDLAHIPMEWKADHFALWTVAATLACATVVVGVVRARKPQMRMENMLHAVDCE